MLEICNEQVQHTLVDVVTVVTSVVAVWVFVSVVVVGTPIIVVDTVAVMLAGVCVAVAVLSSQRQGLASEIISDLQR